MAASRLIRGVAVGATALVTIALSGCAGPVSGSTGAKSAKSTLTLGVQLNNSSWKPAMLYSGLDISMWWGAVYDTWLHCTPSGEPGPGAAESLFLEAISLSTFFLHFTSMPREITRLSPS